MQKKEVYLKSLTPMQRGRLIKLLQKKYILNQQEISVGISTIENLLDNEFFVAGCRGISAVKEKTRRAYNRMDNVQQVQYERRLLDTKIVYYIARVFPTGRVQITVSKMVYDYYMAVYFGA